MLPNQIFHCQSNKYNSLCMFVEYLKSYFAIQYLTTLVNVCLWLTTCELTSERRSWLSTTPMLNTFPYQQCHNVCRMKQGFQVSTVIQFKTKYPINGKNRSQESLTHKWWNNGQINGHASLTSRLIVLIVYLLHHFTCSLINTGWKYKSNV